MKYSVIANKRKDGFDGFRRSGKFFSCEHPTILRDTQITEAILAEPMLTVTEIADDEAVEVVKPKKHKK